MFGKPDNSELKSLISQSKKEIDNIYSKLDTLLDEIDIKISKHNNDIEARLQIFNKEIVDRYFQSMENFLKNSREISLIETLAGQIKDQDLINLQTTLMQPVLNQRWKQEKEDKARSVEENIKSLGEKILDKKNELYNLYIVLNREKKDTSEIERKLEILDWIIELKKE